MHSIDFYRNVTMDCTSPTSTHLLRAKSRPQPWTKSFCSENTTIFIYFFNLKEGKEAREKTEKKKKKNIRFSTCLNHVPYTTPCIPREYSCHYLNKSVHEGRNLNKPYEAEKEKINKGDIDTVHTLHMVANEGQCTSLVSPLFLCFKKPPIRWFLINRK